MRRRDKLDLDAELHRLDSEIARTIVNVMNGPPPTALGNRILAARLGVKLRAQMGQESTPERLALACQQMPEYPDAPPWTPPPVVTPPAETSRRRRWWFWH
jgi:hypothetical protein